MRKGSDQVEIVSVAPDRYAVRGALTFRTARTACESAMRMLNGSNGGGGPIEVDCAGVSESDSAGLAVLVYWLGRAQSAGRGLKFSNIPAEIHALARISDIDEIVEAGV
jgi:phospholipid transport system transporter-binding protein